VQRRSHGPVTVRLTDRPRTDRLRVVLLPGALLLTLAACDSGSDAGTGPIPTTSAPGAVEANATVDRIVDGDTVDVTTVDGDRSERVRLIGIDTPEVAHAASGDRPGNPAECYGDDAKAFTGRLLPSGTAVRLERDVVARDDYGRLLAYVYRASDGVFVNYELARHGFAQPLTIQPNSRFADLIVEATRRAESDALGLWSACRAT
jgi:micrococcal nuclease